MQQPVASVHPPMLLGNPREFVSCSGKDILIYIYIIPLEKISATKTETFLYQVKHQFDDNGLIQL